MAALPGSFKIITTGECHMNNTTDSSNIKDVFNIIESKDGKSHWVKIGTAYVNRDGSINAQLDVFPREGRLQIRDRVKP